MGSAFRTGEIRYTGHKKDKDVGPIRATSFFSDSDGTKKVSL